MRTHRHLGWATRPSLATVAAVAMLAALAGFPRAAARPDGGDAAQAEVTTADPADNDVDVEETVAEVQRRLREDPRLPRLTEDEIRGLVREVAANQTAEPLEDVGATTAPQTTTTTTTTAATTNSSERGDRSLVLVMSHSAANMTDERLQSLFTQPPVTRVVPDELLHHRPADHDHQLHHHQTTAPSRSAEASPGPVRTLPPTPVPPNHRPSYQEPQLHWRGSPPAEKTERPLIFNFFEDEDFLGSTRPPLESTTGHQTSVTTNDQTTQYAEVTEDSATHSQAAEYTTDDIQRPVTNKPPSKPSRVSGYKNQHRPFRGPVRRKKPVLPSGAHLGFGAVTDQTSTDQTPSESAFSYSETSTASPTTTESWKEDVHGAGNTRGDVATKPGGPTDPENFEITVGSYNTKPRITFQQGNLDAESQAADIIYNEDWRPPLAIRPNIEESVTEEHSGRTGQSQTTTVRPTQRPVQHVDTQPFYTRKKPSYITSESILGPRDHPEGSSAFATSNGAVPHHSGGDARPPVGHTHTAVPPRGNRPPSSEAVHEKPPASAVVNSGSRPAVLEASVQPHQTDGPVVSEAASTPPPGVLQRRPGASSSKRRRPIHRKRPVPHDAANVVATVEASYVRDSAAQPAGVQPFRPLDPGLLESLGPLPRPPSATAAPPPPTATTTSTTTTSAAPAESPDVSAAAAALSPAVRDLLQSLGLLDAPPPPPPAAPAPAGPPPPDPAPFRAFKPLPQARAEPQEHDMRQLLHRFGLLDPAPPTRGRRRQKTLPAAPTAADNETTVDGSAPSGSTTTSTTPLTLDAIDTSMLTDEMRAVLRSLGIVPDEPTRRTASPGHETTAGGDTDDDDTDESTERQGPEHVFSPTSLKHSEEESARLQAVLDSVRQFAATHLNATPATEPTAATTTARADRGLHTTTGPSPLAAGPDPLSFEELLAEIHSEESRRNEVKRQQPGDADAKATATTTEREVEEVTSRANRTAEDEARVQALSESFGGPAGLGLDDSGDADYEEAEGGEQAVQRPNGLYFLVDWNSFLRVGEEDKPRVNLRFSPRAGNPRNFLPVTVP